MKAKEYADAMMPGYTHLQRAQPVTMGHHLLAYVEMLDRDADRLKDCRRRLNVSPLGSGAIAGSTICLDRHGIAVELGFDAVTENSMDAIADRDYIMEILFDLAVVGIRLRFLVRRPYDRFIPDAPEKKSGCRGTHPRKNGAAVR